MIINWSISRIITFVDTLMKRIIPFLAICLLMMACKGKGHNSSDIEDEKAKEEKKISKRDYSIDINTAYNDLQIDSMTVAKFIEDRKLPDSISRRIISFYNARNYFYAWFASEGLTEQALGFWNLHNYEVDAGDTILKDKALHKKMDALVADSNLSVKQSDKSMQNIELLLTAHFIEYVLNKFPNHYVKRKEMERFIPIKKEDPIALADSLISKKHKDNKYFEDVNEEYKRLKKELEKYLSIAKSGGWGELSNNIKQYKKDSSDEIAMLKKRLRITGELPGNDTSKVLTETLSNAVKLAQEEYGLSEDGKMSNTLIKYLNVSLKERIEQILININRMRWMPHEPSGRIILVNIPEFELHLTDGKKKVFDMNIIVGKEGHNTMMFTGKLTMIAFSPYWNVPPSIVKKELLPKMASNPDYLESQEMEQIGTEDGLPKIRQKPGEKNALGRVKFLFPNSFNIYLHDTPERHLFSMDKRAFSHGCIRIAEPQKMAEYLLSDNSDWNTEKITKAMYSGQEQIVNIKSPVTVFITYYTAWVDEDGRLNFRDDIYGNDREMAKKMFR
jgi:L,D-transpeptidase YcbB